MYVIVLWERGVEEFFGEKLGFPVELQYEGLAKILVPRMDLYLREDKVYEPAWAPVFYNPRMKFNRDIAVLVARVYSILQGKTGGILVVEPLGGTGVRSIRYVLEAGARAIVNDIDPRAVKLIDANAKMNNVNDRLKVFQLDANELLSSLKRQGIHPDIIDIDPFGGPTPYIDTAIQAIGRQGLLALTATDVASLAGTYPNTLRRRYDVEPARTAWDKEQAVRVLVGYVIRRAASYDYGVHVLLAYYADYYVRVYIELFKGARKAEESLKMLGYGCYCPGCGYTGYVDKYTSNCPYCANKLSRVGPIYTGPLCDRAFLEYLIREAHKISWIVEQRRVVGFLEAYGEECEIEKPYYRIDKLCSILGRNMPKMDSIVEKLREHGYKAARSTFDPRAVKTSAGHLEFLKILSELKT